jgi:hypothetical protein
MLVKIKYKNYEGETKDYTIMPMSLYFGSTIHHKEDQWLLRAFKDNGDGMQVERHFAMKDILAWWQIKN